MASPHIPPATAEVTALTDNRGTIQGTVPRGGSTDDQNLTISGTLSRRLYAGETIRIYDKGSYLGNASVILSPVAGPVRWTFEDPRIWILVYPLPLYFFSFTARVANVFGRLSAPGVAYTATLDQGGPASDTLSLLLRNFTDSGSSSSDRITNDRDFTLTLSGQEAGSTVTYQRSTNSGSTWNATTASQSNLTDGTYQFRALVTDLAGNTATSNSQSVTVDYTAPATTAAITNITDNIGPLGTLAANALTDDPTPTISGTLSAALASGDSLHVYNGATFLGSASVTSTTWSFTPSALANGFYAVTARVADAAGNLGAASTGQRFSLDATANQVIGDANNNILNASSAKDVLTGYVGADTFSFATPSTSTLASFDRITDFNIGTDLLDGPTAVTAANINKLGAVSGLNTTSIGNLLTSASFLADRAATFTYADPSGISRRFIALNDGYAGFDASSDGIVEITGYTGLIANLAVI